MSKLTIAALCVLMFLLAIPQAEAACPANTNPLQMLVGSWAFRAEGVSFYGEGAAGSFAASIATSGPFMGRGVLSITTSYNFYGTVSRLEKAIGTYQIFPDCSGGTLSMNLANRPVAYDFWFASGGTQLYMVSADNGLSVLTGTASKL